MKTAFTLTLLALISASISFADTIYKSVDERGNVSYSTTPPANKKATTIDLAPPPSEERVNAAQQRHERNMEAAEILDENRKKRDAQIAEENRLKRERQEQQKLQQQAEENNENQSYGYPYYRQRPPGRPVINPPVTLPAR